MQESIAIRSVEIAHLDLAYAYTRIRRQRPIVTLADSLMRCGQLLPIVVIAGNPSGFVLIDGYKRVEAARRAGLDTLKALIWPGDACEALCRLLASNGARPLDVFEQAAVLRELKTTHRLTQNQIAAKMGRHPSWVTRRLALIDQLPKEAVDAVRDGYLSSWSASRVLVPLARANAGHARLLVKALSQQRMTSRQLDQLWQHYQKANRPAREKMVTDPLLFSKSLAARKAEQKGQLGPEGRWLNDLRTAALILGRLEKMVGQVFYPNQDTFQQDRLVTPFNDIQDTFHRLKCTIRRLCHEKRNRPSNRDRFAPGRPEHPGDQPADQDVQKDHSSHPCRPDPRTDQPAQPL
ncbi:MAG: ParB/RepB/Spo0J family partition protein [Desulfobacterales bacterium]|jgi:ParB/RepB/Spo0J family partition protein